VPEQLGGAAWARGRRTGGAPVRRQARDGRVGMGRKRNGGRGPAGKDAEGRVLGAGVFEEWQKRVISLAHKAISILSIRFTNFILIR
jgi:hypothetical protein